MKANEYIQVELIDTKTCKNHNVKVVYRDTFKGTDLRHALKLALGECFNPEEVVLKMVTNGYAKLVVPQYDGPHEFNLHLRKVSEVECAIVNEAMQELMMGSAKS